MQKAENCSCCGIPLTGKGNTSFLCPSCGQQVIGRCEQCRNQSVKYYCKICNFSGP